jgi:hypothetical protein
MVNSKCHLDYSKFTHSFTSQSYKIKKEKLYGENGQSLTKLTQGVFGWQNLKTCVLVAIIISTI